MNNEQIRKLNNLALSIRKDVLEMTFNASINGGHIGGAFSCAEILSVLYGQIMNISPQKVLVEDRDRFVLSKGHVSIAHYAVLCEMGFISRDQMLSFEQTGGRFPTHEMKNRECGIEVTSGSLGYGLSLGVGIALAGKRKGLNYKTYVLLGDGECNEGSVWEGALSAVKLGLENLTVIVDMNKQQMDGFTKEIMPFENLPGVFREYGYSVIEVDGHSVEELADAFLSDSDHKPKAVIAHTIKGKGIAEIENQKGWHHVSISEEQYSKFRAELEQKDG